MVTNTSIEHRTSYMSNDYAPIEWGCIESLASVSNAQTAWDLTGYGTSTSTTGTSTTGTSTANSLTAAEVINLMRGFEHKTYAPSLHRIPSPFVPLRSNPWEPPTPVFFWDKWEKKIDSGMEYFIEKITPLNSSTAQPVPPPPCKTPPVQMELF